MNITDEYVQEQIGKGKRYCVSFLIEGPKYRDYPAEQIEENHWAHLRYLFSLQEAGKLVVNGPMSDHAMIKGLSIWDTADLDEVRTLLSNDPAVQAGRFLVEVFPYFSIPGSMLP
jgi:uncharacterized protein